MILFLVWRKEQTTFLCQGIVKNNTERKLWGSSGEFFRGLKSLVDTDERWAPGTEPPEHLQRGSAQNELPVREEKWRRGACTADSKREKVRRRPGRKQEGKKHREGQDLKEVGPYEYQKHVKRQPKWGQLCKTAYREEWRERRESWRDRRDRRVDREQGNKKKDRDLCLSFWTWVKFLNSPTIHSPKKSQQMWGPVEFCQIKQRKAAPWKRIREYRFL